MERCGVIKVYKIFFRSRRVFLPGVFFPGGGVDTLTFALKFEREAHIANVELLFSGYTCYVYPTYQW